MLLKCKSYGLSAEIQSLTQSAFSLLRWDSLFCRRPGRVQSAAKQVPPTGMCPYSNLVLQRLTVLIWNHVHIKISMMDDDILVYWSITRQWTHKKKKLQPISDIYFISALSSPGCVFSHLYCYQLFPHLLSLMCFEYIPHTELHKQSDFFLHKWCIRRSQCTNESLKCSSSSLGVERCVPPLPNP